MGANNQPPQIENIQQYKNGFQNIARDIRTGPKEDRSCQDVCCVIVFLLILGFFVGVGAYYINLERPLTNYGKLANSNSTSHDTQTFFSPTHQLAASSSASASASTSGSIPIPDMSTALPIIGGMLALAFVLSIVLVCLIAKFPKCLVYTMIVMVFLIFVVIGVLLLVQGQLVGLVFLALVAILFACVCCCREQLEMGIALLKISGDFLIHKPTVFLAPILMGIIVLLMETFWILSIVALALNRTNESSGTISAQDPNTSQTILSVFLVFANIFFVYFFFYIMVFLIAVACALWYFGIDKNYLTTGLKWIFGSHVGSLTFASVLIAIVTMLKNAAKNEQRQQGNQCAQILWCCIACCLQSIENLLKVLNNNAIIMMSVTGESYIESAKHAIYVITYNFPLFAISESIGSLLSFCGMLLISGVPALIGYFLLQKNDPNPETQSGYVGFGVVAIVISAMMVGLLFLSVITESLSSVFIFYCLDRRFAEMSVKTDAPHQMKQLFQDFDNHSASQNEGPNYQNQNQQNYPNQPQNYQNRGQPEPYPQSRY